MSDDRPTRPGRLAFLAVGLVVLGVGFWALSALTRDTEPRAFARDGQAPYTVQLTAGRTYQLAVQDGADGAGLAQGSARCVLTSANGVQSALEVTANSSKAIDQPASFVSPVSGRVHVECAGVSQVFVDGADDQAFDHSGLFLVLASLALAVGLPLLLTVARDALRAPARTPAGAAVPAA